MSFADDLGRFTAKVETRSRDVFNNTASHVLTSIRDGSPVTGAPGQPVGQYGPGYHQGEVGGELKGSWQLHSLGPWEAEVSTFEPYAKQNEDGIARPGGGPYTQRSTVGGRFSVTITRAGIQKITDVETAKVNP